MRRTRILWVVLAPLVVVLISGDAIGQAKKPSGGSGAGITALTGDVTATGPGSAAATVALVGGSTASAVNTATVAANAATNANTASTIVKRDSSGNFTAGTITAALTGTASGNPTGTGNASYVPYWTSTTALSGDSLFQWDATHHALAVGAAPDGTTTSLQIGGYVVQTSSAVGTVGAITGVQSIGNNTTAYNASPQSGLIFFLKTSSGGTLSNVGGFSLAKENATDGNTASSLGLFTQANSGTPVKQVNISSAGRMLMPGTLTDDGSSIIQAAGNIALTTGTGELLFGTSTHNQPSIQNNANGALTIWDTGASHTIALAAFSASGPVTLKSAAATGGNASGLIVDTNSAFSTSGDELARFKTGGTEKAGVKYTGVFSSTGVAPTLGANATLGYSGDIRHSVAKYTVEYTRLTAASTTADLTICTIPAAAKVVGVIVDVTQALANGAGTFTVQFGKTTGGNEYVVSSNAGTVATYGLVDGDLGTTLNRAGAVQGGDIPSWGSTTALKARFTSSANFNANSGMTAGNVNFYVVTEAF